MLEAEEPHDKYRILLFYCYVTIPEVRTLIEFHQDFQEIDTTDHPCNINIDCDKDRTPAEYIDSITSKKPRYGGRIRVAPEGLNGVLSGLYTDLLVYEERLREILTTMAPSSEWDLDMKYCELRRDLAIDDQLFAELQVTKTCQVVALVDMNDYTMDEAKDENANEKSCKGGDSGNRRYRRKQERKEKKSGQIVNVHQYRQAQDIFSRSLKSLPSLSGTPKHLLPAEWDAKLQELANRRNSIRRDNDLKIILLDCRNSYESAVGYFQAPGASTVLTNTRKYSELPFVLMDQSDKLLAEATHIFAYCTGGVRCERATIFLQTLLCDKKQQPSESTTATPEIYQLYGGIQRYLESPSTDGLFQGKNFVFDPRRTDPLNSEKKIVVGRCLVCTQPHDDYDNGHAPSKNMEARCFKCRILVLVCSDCRNKVCCWGDASGDATKPKLFCGGMEPSECLHMPPVREIVPEELK